MTAEVQEIVEVRRRFRPSVRALALPGCVAVAAASLAVPSFPGYDPWVWLVWGREALDGGPVSDGTISWKPLPVLLTTVLAPFGDAALPLWTVVVRALSLFGLVVAFRLAARFAGPGVRGVGAGAVAVAAMALTPDAESRWVRLVLQTNIDPVTVTLCLWAVERDLDGRRAQAVLLGCAAALTRPEVWPLLAVYAGWAVWRAPRRWWAFVAPLPLVPLLWFGGDRLASGSPTTGVLTAAAVLEPYPPGQRLQFALDAAAAAVPLPVWIAAAVGIGWAVFRRRIAPLVLAAAALVWTAEVVVMAVQFGFAAIGRFYVVPAAALCVLAGVGFAALVRLPRTAALRGLLAVALLAAAVPAALPRAAWLPAQFAAAAHRAELGDRLDALIAETGGIAALRACGPITIDYVLPATEYRPALMWKLDLPMAGLHYSLRPGPSVVLTQPGSEYDRLLRSGGDPAVRTVRLTPDWNLFTVRCQEGPR